jgi:uncharacterized membrane protein YkvA (DUF1232 family)
MIFGRPWAFWARIGLLWLADLVYTASPVDLSPDVLPIVGQVDDAALFILTVLWTLYQMHRSGRSGAAPEIVPTPRGRP